MDIFDLSLSDLKTEGIIDYTSKSYKTYYKDNLITSNYLKNEFNLAKRIEYDNYLFNLVKQSGVKVIDINFANNTVKTELG